MTIVGIIITAIGSLILAYPLWKSEPIRRGQIVKPRGKGKDDSAQINKALQRIGKPYFWTDRKIYILGSAITVVGVFFLIFGAFL